MLEINLYRSYGTARLLAIALLTAVTGIELGTPGHSLCEAVCVGAYLICLIEAATHAWTSSAD